MAAENLKSFEKSQRGNLHQGNSPKDWAGSKYQKSNDKTPGTKNNTDFAMAKSFQQLIESNDTIMAVMEESPFLAEFVKSFVEVLDTFGNEVAEEIRKSQEEQIAFNEQVEEVVKSLSYQATEVEEQTHQLANGEAVTKSINEDEVLVKSHPGDQAETRQYAPEDIQEALWKSFEAGDISGLEITKFETSNGVLSDDVARKIGLAN